MCEFMCLHMHGSGGRCVARMHTTVQMLAQREHACSTFLYMAMCECICTFIHTRICEHAYFTMHVHACPTVAFGSGGKQTSMEREPASDIITGVGSRRPRIDATDFHKKRKRRQNTRIALLGGLTTARRTRRSRRIRRPRPMKRSELMVTPMVKKKPKPRTIVELKPKIMPKPRPRPMGPTEKDALPSVPEAADPLILVIDLTVDPHSAIDLTGV